MLNRRHQQIIELLVQERAATVPALAERFGVTPMTIRRDLEYLEGQHLLVRTRGGAMHAQASVIEFAFKERNRQRLAEKQAISRAAAALIHPGMAVTFDTGTTPLEVARAIARTPDLRVLTSSLAVASLLYATPNIDLILLGGNVRQDSPDLSGSLTEENLSRFRPDLAVLGADAVDRDGLYTTDLKFAHVSRAMIANGTETLFVVDSDKFTRRSFVKFAVWQQVHHLVTDSGIAAEDREWLLNAVPDVRIVTP
ncbi:MAG: DeoR/GlpR family DNA-binding transcription regulator [Armatimonadota bacterium]